MGFFVTSSLLCADSEPCAHVVPDQETHLLKTQTLFLPPHPQMDFNWVVSMADLLPWLWAATVCRGNAGLEKEAQLEPHVHLLPHLN